MLKNLPLYLQHWLDQGRNQPCFHLTEDQLAVLIKGGVKDQLELVQELGRLLCPERRDTFEKALRKAKVGPTWKFLNAKNYSTAIEKWEAKNQHGPIPELSHGQDRVELPYTLTLRMAREVQKHLPEKIGQLPIKLLEQMDLSPEEWIELLEKTQSPQKRRTLLRVAGKITEPKQESRTP